MVWNEQRPEDLDQQIEYVKYLIQGWLKNMTTDAVAKNTFIAPEAVSVALRAIADDFDGVHESVTDEELEKWLEDE